MFDSDLLIAFFVMALLFIRQIMILKEAHKINYAPLILGIGAIGSITHFMLHPDSSDHVLILRESLFPMLVAIILYVIMNILHQTQLSFDARKREELSVVLAQEITGLKSFIVELENRMATAQQQTLQTQEEVRNKFVEDIAALSTIEANQKNFFEKLSQVEVWHDDVKKSFVYFSEEQLPKLDDVVHKHIDILRISEKDHYNKLQELLKKAVESRFGIADDIAQLHQKLDQLKMLAKNISNDIVRESTAELSDVVKDFESEMLLLKSNAGVVSTSLHESETTLSHIRSQSELIMKQMLLSSKKMDEITDKSSNTAEFLHSFELLLDDVEKTKREYMQVQMQLSELINNFSIERDENFTQLSQKIDMALKELQEQLEQYKESVHAKTTLLAKQAQVQNSYSKIDK